MLQLQSTVKKEGVVELGLARVPIPELKPDEVLVRMEAAPINPSDLGLLLGLADASAFTRVPAAGAGASDGPMVSASVPASFMKALAPRVGLALPVGNEGAGRVVKAGDSAQAQALLGKTVGIVGGSTYSQYRAVKLSQCMAFPEGVSAADCASCFVNPMTALGFVETMRAEGHKAMVHTAAASNLGQMLNKICINDGIDLVNIVRKQDQADMLRAIGAKYVVDSSTPSFKKDLTAACVATGATLAFDATGGGTLASDILSCMEAAASANQKEYSRYGSTTHKQLYIYGRLDRRPLTISATSGFAWGIGGWLLTPVLEKLPKSTVGRLRNRVIAEIKTTFASKYTQEVSLAEALDVDVIRAYGKQATGEKYLINPSKGVPELVHASKL